MLGLSPGRRAGDRARNAVDEAELVWVPAGEFPMGSTDGKGDEQPVRRVRITRRFWLYRTPVTNAQYRRFLAANPKYRKPEYWTDSRYNGAGQPVVGVDCEDAAAYCGWAGGGCRRRRNGSMRCGARRGGSTRWGTRIPQRH